MKKPLTPNISRYDSKIRLRFNLRTFRIATVSALIGLVFGFLLNLLLPSIYATGLGVITALLSFLLQLVELEGKPLISLIVLVLQPPGRRQYEHTAVRPEDRLTIEKKNERKDKNE